VTDRRSNDLPREDQPGIGSSSDPGGLAPGTQVEDYVVRAPLARGGMSRVYIAEHGRLGRRVALKMLDSVRFSGRRDENIVRRRFFREARIIASLVHENIVDVYDVGEWNGVPYMALRLVDGLTLGARIRTCEPPPIDEALRQWIDVAKAVAFAHEQSVFHRDLKPDNVMLSASGRAFVLDFGLARILDQTADTTSGIVVGTPAYLAPEIIRGEAISAASDVFSLGVTFYEYLTGQYPFSRAALAYSIAYEEAPAPTSLRADLPHVVGAILLRALAKDPRDRYPTFKALLHDLEAVGESLADGESPGRVEEILAWQASVEQRNLVLPFGGREAELSQLEETLAAVGAGTGQAVAVVGDAGLGKSRLVEELCRRARLRQIGTYVGRAVETGGRSPYQPFKRVLRHWADQNGARSMADLERAVGDQMPELQGSVSVLGGLLGLVPRVARDRDHLFEVVSLFLAGLADERPAVVVLEDLHVADEASLALLQHVLLDVPRRRLALIVTLRPDDSRSHHQVRDLCSRQLVDEIELRPLAGSAVADILERLFVSAGDAERLIEPLQRETAGNPLFLTEVLKLLKSRRAITPQARGYVLVADPSLTALPEGMRAVVRRRLRELTPEERELADLAATYGADSFRAGDLEAALRLDRAQLLRMLQQLERRHHLLVTDPNRQIRFGHDRVREVLYDDMDAALRAEYHALIARQLERRGGDDHAPALARHWEAAGDDVAAARWHRCAGQLAETSFAYVASVEHYERALDLDPESERGQTLLALGQQQRLIGQHEEAAHTTERLASFAEQTDDQDLLAGAAILQASLLAHRGQHQAAIEFVLDALTRPYAQRSTRTVIDLLSARAEAYRHLRDWKGAADDLARAAELARDGDADRQSHVLLTWSDVAMRSGDLEMAVSLVDRAERSPRSNPRDATRVFQARGLLERRAGRFDDALASLAHARELAPTPLLVAQVSVNLAATAGVIGDYQREWTESEQAVEAARRTSDPTLLAAAQINLLEACEECGRLARGLEVLAELRRVVSYAPEMSRAVAALEEGALYCELGRIDDGRDRLRKVISTGPGAVAGAARFRLGLLELELDEHEAGPLLTRAREDLRAEPTLAARAAAALARHLAHRGQCAAGRSELESIAPESLGCITVLRDRALAHADLAAAVGDHRDACAALEEAIQHAQRQGARLREVEALAGLAAQQTALADDEHADRTMESAATILATIASELTEEKDRQQLRRRRPFRAIRDTTNS